MLSRVDRVDRATAEIELGVHLVLLTLHGLAAFWHLRRRRWLHGALHLAGVSLDGYAAVRHMREMA